MTTEEPHQFTRADLASMTPAAIDAARRAGQLATVLSGCDPANPSPTCNTCGQPIPPATT